VVNFNAKVDMARAEFTAGKQAAYVVGVAQALSVAPSRVAIAMITVAADPSDGQFRSPYYCKVLTTATVALAPLSPARLCSLASCIARRPTAVASSYRLTARAASQVPKDKAAGVAAAVTAQNLNRALASSGISVGAILSKTLDGAAVTVTKPSKGDRQPQDRQPAADFGRDVPMGLLVTSFVAVGFSLLLAAARCCYVRCRRVVQQDQFTGDVRIPPRTVNPCFFSQLPLPAGSL
jgi:hypothetical protein